MLVDLYGQLLSSISDDDLPASQKERMIVNSYDPGFARAIFLDGGVRIEFDLTPGEFENGSQVYQLAPDYLKAFELFFDGHGNEGAVETRFLGCKTFLTTYAGAQVVFEMKLKGTDPKGIPFGASRKMMETIAMYRDSSWRVYIKGITHFSDTLDGFTCATATEEVIEKDSLPDDSEAPNPGDHRLEIKGNSKSVGSPVFFNHETFLGNAYFALNYQLVNHPLGRAGSFPFFRFDKGWENLGFSFYAPVGLYLFGIKNDKEIPEFREFTLSELNKIVRDLENQGWEVENAEFSGYGFSGRIFHAGIVLGPFFKIKYVRHLFLTAGMTFVDGKGWDEYEADFKGQVPPSLEENIYATDIGIYDNVAFPELGLAVVFPYGHTEFTFCNFQKTFSWKLGVNLPFRLFVKK